jgi:hypothetical protein
MATSYMQVAQGSIDRILSVTHKRHPAHDQYLLGESIVGLCPAPAEEMGI